MSIDTQRFVQPGEDFNAYTKRMLELNESSAAEPTATPAPASALAPNQSTVPNQSIAPTQSLPNPTPAPTATPAPSAAKPYTVQQGDTLSSIATKFGVPIQSITGYRSGDPNLINVGETLSIGTSAPTQTPAPSAPTQTPTSTTTPVEATPDENGDLQKMYMDALIQSMGGDGMSDVPPNLQPYGVDPFKMQQGFQSNPQQTVSDLVQQVLQAAQLPDVKSSMDTLTKQIEDIANERDERLKEIDDNPFLSAASKNTQKDQINDKYELRIKNRQARVELLQNAYDSAKQEAQFAATTAINLYDRNRNFDQGRLEFAMTQAEKRLESMRKMQELNPAEFKEIRGGLFNIRTKEWVVQPNQSGGGGDGGLYDQYDFRTANAILSERSKFDQHIDVKRYTNLIDSRNAINGIDPKTKNPADHQAIIYNFAKALDPESVVREGEYETIKKYSQGFFTRYKGEINQAINGTGFLSEKAIKDIQSTINQRVLSSQRQYDNVAQQFARNIDEIAGEPGTGSRFLVDYNATNDSSGGGSQPIQTTANPDGTVTVTDPDGGSHVFPDSKSAIAFKNAISQ